MRLGMQTREWRSQMAKSTKRFWMSWWQSGRRNLGWFEGTKETADGQHYNCIVAIVDAKDEEEAWLIIKLLAAGFTSQRFCKEQDHDWIPYGPKYHIMPDWEPLTIEILASSEDEYDA